LCHYTLVIKLRLRATGGKKEFVERLLGKSHLQNPTTRWDKGITTDLSERL
jgi:hypothetical protein